MKRMLELVMVMSMILLLTACSDKVVEDVWSTADNVNKNENIIEEYIAGLSIQDAEETQSCGKDLTWYYLNDVLIITGTGPMDDFNIDDEYFGRLMPYTIDFKENLVKLIRIEEGCTAIGNNAFNRFITLTNVMIPNTVTSIGDRAFWNCYNLSSVNLPDTLTTIGDSAFKNCESLEKITIPKNVTSIGEYAFSNCKNLVSVSLPKELTDIPENVFESCDKLTNLNYY